MFIVMSTVPPPVSSTMKLSPGLAFWCTSQAMAADSGSSARTSLGDSRVSIMPLRTYIRTHT